MAFNSDLYAWKDMSIVLDGRTVTGVQAVKYKVSSDDAPVFGAGKKALAIMSGNESVEGSITLLQPELELLQAAAQAARPGAKFTDFYHELVCSYENGFGKAVTDVIKYVKFTEFEKGMEQNDKEMPVEISFLALDVEYNV